jgi:tetratricopeptide (TPR) repeat protein
MSSIPNVPLFFFAFSNSLEYNSLKGIEKESKVLYELLLPLKKARQIDLLREHHTDQETIPQRLTDFKNQIYIFHYGGHADGKHLFFENRKGHSQGLAQLLSLQKSLRLVFLNGCETQLQAREYIEAGIPAVIATTRKIKDSDAVYFAENFYRALIEQQTLGEAFSTACGALKTKSDSYDVDNDELVVLRSAKWNWKTSKSDQPWRLYINKKNVLDWQIPQIVQGEHKITLVLANSESYRVIREKIGTLENAAARKRQQIADFPSPLPESLQKIKSGIQTEWLELTKELEQVKQQEREFKEEVLKLAESFETIEISTKRLQKAKSCFEKGQFREADAILQTEEMILEKDKLLDILNRKEQELGEIRKELRHKADEFLVKARLTISLQKEKSNWFDEVISYFEHSIDSDRGYENVLVYAEFLAKHHKFNKAESLYNQLLKYPLTAKQKADIIHGLGYLYYNATDYDKARSSHEEALQIYRQLAEEDPKTFLVDTGQAIIELGAVYWMTNNYTGAESCYSEALHIYRQLALDNKREYQQPIANILNNIGALYRKMGNYKLVGDNYDKALKIYRQLAEEDSHSHQPNLGRIFNNLCNLHYVEGNFERAKEYSDNALHIYKQLAEVNPHAYLPVIASILNNRGNLLQSMRLIQNALDNYQESLVIRRELAEFNPQAFLPGVAHVLTNLGVFYFYDANDKAESSRCFEEALDIYRKLATVNPETFQEYVAKVLGNLGWCYYKMGNYSEALQKLEEALQIKQQLAVDNSPASLSDVAWTLTNMGLLKYKMGNHIEAQQYSEEAIQIYSELDAEDQDFKLGLARAFVNIGMLILKRASKIDQAMLLFKEPITVLQSYVGEASNAKEYLDEIRQALKESGFGQRYVNKLLDAEH